MRPFSCQYTRPRAPLPYQPACRPETAAAFRASRLARTAGFYVGDGTCGGGRP